MVKTEDCVVNAHLSGPIDAEFEATADDIKTEANEPVEHAFTEEHSDKWMNSDSYTLRQMSLLHKRIKHMIAVETSLACRGEYPPDDAAQSHQELPQRHVLLADRHHQRAGVVLHKDAGNAVTARGVVYHPLLGNKTARW